MSTPNSRPPSGEDLAVERPAQATPAPRRRHAWARRAAVGAAVVALVAAGGLAAALWRYAGTLPPLDLASSRERSTVVLDRDGRLLRAFTMADGRWRLPVTTKDVDPRFLGLLMAYEDRHFDTHGGVDPWAMLRAAGQMVTSGRIVSGGSTLTMQVARLLEPREERSFAAKLRQVVRALELERRFTKDEILKLYLGLAPYGGNLEGIRAASFAYFGKEPKRLSYAEAALLVALPQSPEARRPDRAQAAARSARDRVLDRALAHGLLTVAEADNARAEPVPRDRRPFPSLAAHAAEAAVKAEPAERVHRLTIEARLQASLEALARENAERAGDRISAAILVVDNATGAVRAHVGAADYFSAERAGAVDAAFAARSPGSALKPFIYALAFENGIAHPETILDDRPSRYGLYAPENFDLSFQGTVTARRALQLSLNVPTVELLAEIGPPRLLARLKTAGADIVLPKEGGPPGLAIALGGLGIRLADLARLYAGLARGGEVPTLMWKQGAHGTERDARIAEPVAAWYVADILKGAPPPANALPGRIAFKTGTSYGYRDAWAVGFDRRTTIAVWLGRPDGTAVPGLVARQVAAPMLFEAFARLGEEPEPIPAPRNVLFATSATLPPPLRHLRKDAPKTIAATASGPLRIAYPPDGARVDLGLGRPGGEGANALAMKASGGIPPLIWLVNGAPVTEREIRRQTSWTPDGAGFARVSVIDAQGATDSVTIRVE